MFPDMKRPDRIVVQFVHIQGPLKGEIQEVEQELISIGRHPSCLLRFPPDLTVVSRKHADILREGPRFKLIDHSSNGTFVNGKKVKEVYLKDGDVLAFGEGGPKVSFLTQIKEEAEPIHDEVQVIQTMPEPVPARVSSAEPAGLEKGSDKPPEIIPEKVSAPLVIQYGPTIRFFKVLPITLGKDPKCDLVMEHPAVMSQHAQIFFAGDQYWIKDLTGQKLVSINGRQINFQAPLLPNDSLSLTPQGPVFQFLGEGRLVEIEQPSSKEAPCKPKETAEPEEPEQKRKKVWSIFKKILER